MLAAMAGVEREFIHERTLTGLVHRGRERQQRGRRRRHAAVALRRRDANEPSTSIARHLGVGRSTLYWTLSAYEPRRRAQGPGRR